MRLFGQLPWRIRLVAYGARLLSGFRVTPDRGFESLILRPCEVSRHR